MDVLQKTFVGMVKRMENIEKIKKDAETCLNHPPSTACNYCDLYSECDGYAEHIIKELYDLVVYYESRLAQVEKERDAMEHDFLRDPCEVCKRGPTALDDCRAPYTPCKFEWRGVCAENTKEEIHES